MSVVLDLVELDGKATPEAIVYEIFRQNPQVPIPVPVEELAELAGVEDIHPLTTSGFEGMLVTNDDKTRGEIFYKAGSIPQRKRFTVGHELGHFLIPHHKQSTFECTKEDMGRYDRNRDPRFEQEAEANRFASELLMPASLFKNRMRALGEPKMEDVDLLRREYLTSLEATARRYVRLSDYPCAVVFAKDRAVRYYVKSDELPYFLDIKPGCFLPRQSSSFESGAGLANWREVNGWVWLEETRARPLPSFVLEQVLWQQEGYKVVLLFIEDLPDEDE